MEKIGAITLLIVSISLMIISIYCAYLENKNKKLRRLLYLIRYKYKELKKEK